MDHPSSISFGVGATAPYARHPPNAPYIHIPSISNDGKTFISIVPSFKNVESSQLTQEDLNMITQGKTQIAYDSTTTWVYESRRTAQPVLDFLYLGPASVARDRDFLTQAGITMILVARDTRMAARFMNVQRTAEALHIVTESIDTSGSHELIRAFPSAIQKINGHLLDVYRSQVVHDPELGSGKAAIDSANFKRGKVLVCCESGNDRSALLVAAYLMDMFGLDLIHAVQFLSLQRFCVNLDDEAKNLLQSYEDILKAKRDVSRARHGLAQASDRGTEVATISKPQSKRTIEDLLEDEDVDMEIEAEDGRGFAPFAEEEYTWDEV
ncbi:dual specificity phosphatase [Podospora appendiculata]|uniref:Dual specificity phosphatase n=1 Tax=Podospora appendiculata TaxID=314037 RepID=A0AAE0X7J4_9PEZI|nr:dual specificity phosphatase [Podospora appendiculata]